MFPTLLSPEIELAEEEGRPSHHANESATSFRNPWGESKSLLASGQVLLSKFPLEWENQLLHDHPASRCKVVKPDFGRNSPDKGTVKATWLGHAGFLVQLAKDPSSHNTSKEPVRVLLDPIWSERASPSQMVGPRRRLQPPCSLQELPEFDFVVISHNHYDHLDWPTIEQISKLPCGPLVRYLVPLRNKTWFCSMGIPPDQITELDWWEEAVFPLPRGVEDSNSLASGEIRFICTPAQHGSGRSLHDQRATLWASWVVKQTIDEDTVIIYHAGDTGYMTEAGPCPVFKEIGEKYGPFDLAMLPIWRGSSLSFIASMGLRLSATDISDGLHASPAHAVALHKDIRSRHSLGMHFATFAGSDIEAFEPIVELIVAKEKENVGELDEEWGFGTIDVGATVTLPVATK